MNNTIVFFLNNKEAHVERTKEKKKGWAFVAAHASLSAVDPSPG
jgi:hypothetical protein